MSRDVGYNLGRMFGSIPEPASAYADLVTQMAHVEGGFIWTEDEARALVDAVLNEAAERIRCADAPEGREDTFDAGAVWASDLIRPADEPLPKPEPVSLDDSPLMAGVRAWAKELDELEDGR